MKPAKPQGRDPVVQPPTQRETSTMFNKHFKPDKKVLIQLANPEQGHDRIENISASCLAVENGILTLSLPYEIDPAMFSANPDIHVMTESLGMGLKGRACFHCQQTPTLVQLRFDGDLQFFQRRPSPRLTIPIGVRYSRTNGSLAEVRRQWRQHISVLAATEPDAIPKLPNGLVNLSSGGIRLGFRNDIAKAQLCLLLLQVEPDTQPICTVAEVVWAHAGGKDANCTAGLQFMAIMAEDQKRLEKFIRFTRLSMRKKQGATSQ